MPSIFPIYTSLYISPYQFPLFASLLPPLFQFLSFSSYFHILTVLLVFLPPFFPLSYLPSRFFLGPLSLLSLFYFMYILFPLSICSSPVPFPLYSLFTFFIAANPFPKNLFLPPLSAIVLIPFSICSVGSFYIVQTILYNMQIVPLMLNYLYFCTWYRLFNNL